MTIVVVDTSALLAIADRAEPDHNTTRLAAGSAGTLLVSPFVLAETDHLARRLGRAGREALLDGVIEELATSRMILPEVSTDHAMRARSVMRRYRDLDLDLTDAVNVTLAAAYATNVVLTLDRRDFRAIEPLTAHAHFRLLPDDL